MPQTIDPAVEASKALARARYLMAEREESVAAFLDVKPTTARGARLHLMAAWRERHDGEEHAAGWAAEYRRQAAGGRAASYARAEAARFAALDNAPMAARKIKGAARLLARRRQGALSLLRQALAIVRGYPLPGPETDNAAIERHLKLALAFLAKPRVV
jgi:hypothetical protein